jgi:hypothetical protein
MTIEGHVENGRIILHGDVPLAEGMRVRVELLSGNTPESPSSAGTQFDHYQAVIGAIDDLPSDFAARHDHYIHGTPKE